MAVLERLKSLKHAWNAFTSQDTREFPFYNGGYSHSVSPFRTKLTYSNERSINASILTRMSIDVAAVGIRHVRMDSEKRYKEDMPSDLNDCLTVEPNKDQSPRQFRQDIAMQLFDKGVIAIIPVDSDLDPHNTGGFSIQSMRVGEIKDWEPDHVTVEAYNDRKGKRETLRLEKKFVAIVENPLYSVMNEQNSTLQRLIRKLNMLDAVDEQSSSGKLDLIIQLPYVIKSEARRQQAEQRRKDIEFQLKGSQYGIAYTDGTERITQLNRPAENNLWKQITDLTDMLYTQLGLTPEVMNGTADEATMLNYYERSIRPVLDAITEAMIRTFLTKTARSQLQSIMYFKDPFKFVPLSQFADIVDKLTRNKVATSNEMRGVIGWKPSTDPSADKLENANMPTPAPAPTPPSDQPPPLTETGGNSQNGS